MTDFQRNTGLPASAVEDLAAAPASVEDRVAVPTVVTGQLVAVQTFAQATLAILAVFYALSVSAEIIVPLLLAAVLKLLLQPAMRLLCEKLHFPTTLAAFVLIVSLFGLLIGIAMTIAVPASGWLEKAPQGLATLQERLSILRQPLALFHNALTQVEHLAQPPLTPGEAMPVAVRQPTDFSAVGLTILRGAESFMGRFFIVIVVLFFMLAAGDSMLRKLVEVVPNFRDKKHVVFISNEIERNVSGYLVTITLVNIVVGVLNGGFLFAYGVPDPLLWGTVAFLLNYIPILGPLVGVVVLFVVGLLTFSTLGLAVVPAGFYLLVHVAEGQIATPMLLARRFTLNPVIVIIGLFFWYWLWGIPGALLSVPLLAIFKIVCDRISSLAPLGHMLGVADGGRTLLKRRT